MPTLELAKLEDGEICYNIINEGKAFQLEQGFVQWTEDYPSTATIYADISAKNGYVINMDGNIAGYMCISFDKEPVYELIQGEWSTDASYAVVHRMAFSKAFRGMGLTEHAFRLIEELCVRNGVRAIRVDTDCLNKRMQHILAKNGFERRGTVVFRGSEKLAYDKSF